LSTAVAEYELVLGGSDNNIAIGETSQSSATLLLGPANNNLAIGEWDRHSPGVRPVPSRSACRGQN